MRITLPATVFAAEVAWLARLLPTRPAIPVTAAIRLEAGHDGLRATVFDYEVCAHVDLDADITEAGTALVPGRLVAAAAAQLPDEPLTLTVEAATVTLECGPARWRLHTLPLEDYPTTPHVPTAIGHVETARLREAVARTAIAAGTDPALPGLTAVQIGLTTQAMTLSATDRYRAARHSLDWASTGQQDPGVFLVDHRTLTRAAKTLAGTTLAVGTPTIVDETGLSLSGDHRHVITRLIDAPALKIDTLFDTSGPRLRIETQRLREAVRRVSAVAAPTVPLVLDISTCEVTVRTESSVDTAIDTVPATFDADPLTIGVQPRWIADALAAIPTATTHLTVTTPTNPVLISPEEGMGYQHVLCPQRLAHTDPNAT